MAAGLPTPVAAFVLLVAIAAIAVTVTVTVVSLTLVALSVLANARYTRAELVRTALLPKGQLAPPVTIIVPAYNEASSIVASVRSLLQLTYAAFEVVVVDDGSTDGTFDALAAAFELTPTPYLEPSRPVRCQPIVDVHVARGAPLRVVRKGNGGKADAQNAGLNVCRTPYVCLVDADSVVARDALDRCVARFADDPNVVAVGAGIGVANGCEVVDGHVGRIGLAPTWLARFQTLEYLRSFLYGRIGWAAMGGTLIVSGAFGVFRRDALEAVGGLRPGALGEDLDLVLRLHRHRVRYGNRWRIAFLPETLCFTEVPTDAASLRSQRIRWQRGLFDALVVNRALLLRRGSGAAGWVSAPYHLVAELLAPALELAGLAATAIAVRTGILDPRAGLLFLLFGFLSSILLSTCALLLDQQTYGLYRRPGQLVALVGVAAAEQLGYRQLMAWWRLRGFVRHLRGRELSWGTITRTAEWSVTSPAPGGTAGP